MKGKDVIFSSARTKQKGAGNDNWQTPWWFMSLVRQLDILACDPCTTEQNPTGALTFYTPAADGLHQPWARQGICFVNPPYSKIRTWLAKCAAEAALGSQVLALVPGRTDTRAFHEGCATAARLAFLRGRMAFVDVRPDQVPVEAPAPFPSMVAYWGSRPQCFAFDRIFAPHAKVMVTVDQARLPTVPRTFSPIPLELLLINAD